MIYMFFFITFSRFSNFVFYNGLISRIKQNNKFVGLKEEEKERNVFCNENELYKSTRRKS